MSLTVLNQKFSRRTVRAVWDPAKEEYVWINYTTCCCTMTSQLFDVEILTIIIYLPHIEVLLLFGLKKEAFVAVFDFTHLEVKSHAMSWWRESKNKYNFYTSLEKEHVYTDLVYHEQLVLPVHFGIYWKTRNVLNVNNVETPPAPPLLKLQKYCISPVQTCFWMRHHCLQVMHQMPRSEVYASWGEN